MKPDVIILEGISPYGLWIKALAILKFSLTKRTYAVVIFILTMLLLCFAGSQPVALWSNFINEIKNNNTGTIINIVEVIFILFLWIANIIIGWQDALGKYLSVTYYCQEKERPEFAGQYALLISESDIRSLAQQIGMQKNNNQYLDLDSSQYQFKKTLSFDRNRIVNSGPFWHYEVTVPLRPPQKERKKSKSNDIKKMIVSHRQSK